jgi:CRP-like cAMP-binding protein
MDMAARKENLLLAALPQDERDRLDPFLEWRDEELKEVLIEPDEPITHVFFPYDAVTSTIQEFPDGSTIETGLMGVEGIIGIQLWLRMPSTPTRTIIQIAGRGHRMTANDFIREIRDNAASPLNPLIARYTHAFLSMTSIVAACNRLHPLEQRMCRWLMLTYNRVRRDEFTMRQEFLAQMLGVQRPTVSITAQLLQQAGLITYKRGTMRLLNTRGLAAGSCECLELMERQMDRIYDQPWRGLVEEGDRQEV